MWLFDAKFDVENLYYQYGYVLGPRLKSSQQYRRLIEWTLKAFNEGTSGKIVARLLAAITGISITENEKEVIEFIHKDTNKITVVTDKTVYNFEGEDVELVEVNDEITLDTPITAGLQVFELNRGIVPESLDRLTIGRGFPVLYLYSTQTPAVLQ